MSAAAAFLPRHVKVGLGGSEKGQKKVGNAGTFCSPCELFIIRERRNQNSLSDFVQAAA